MIHDTFMVFDVESVGLHGEGFAVGYVVMAAGREVEGGYIVCPADVAVGTTADMRWVTANVLPALQSPVGLPYLDHADNPRGVRAKFWRGWQGWQRDHGALLVADVPFPVETTFLSRCIEENGGQAYPLIDVASVRLAAGLDPLATCPRLPREEPAHHPLADARQSARLLLEALKMISAAGRE